MVVDRCELWHLLLLLPVLLSECSDLCGRGTFHSIETVTIKDKVLAAPTEVHEAGLELETALSYDQVAVYQ